MLLGGGETDAPVDISRQPSAMTPALRQNTNMVTRHDVREVPVYFSATKNLN